MSRYNTSNTKSKISDLNKRITIQKFMGVVQNDNGFDKELWDGFKTVWASKNNLFGREFWAAKAVQGENTVEFCIRYGKWIDTIDSKKYRIMHNDKVYNITFIDPVKYENIWVKIKTLELIS